VLMLVGKSLVLAFIKLRVGLRLAGSWSVFMNGSFVSWLVDEGSVWIARLSGKVCVKLETAGARQGARKVLGPPSEKLLLHESWGVDQGLDFRSICEGAPGIVLASVSYLTRSVTPGGAVGAL